MEIFHIFFHIFFVFFLLFVGCTIFLSYFQEIAAALSYKCNIVPVTDPTFNWPNPESLPDDMRSICRFNGVRWIHDYQDACVDKLERFLRGDLNMNMKTVANSTGATVQSQGGHPPSVNSSSVSYHGSAFWPDEKISFSPSLFLSTIAPCASFLFFQIIRCYICSSASSVPTGVTRMFNKMKKINLKSHFEELSFENFSNFFVIRMV